MKSVIFFLATLVAFLPVRAESVVERDITVLASPLQVFNALTVDWQIRQWSGAVGATVDARQGGMWRYTYSTEHFSEGTYETVIRPERLVFSLMAAGAATRASVDMLRSGDSTQIRIRHDSDIPGSSGDSVRVVVIRFWEDLLPRLTAYLTRAPGSYMVKPQGTGPYPAILVLHDRFGLSRTIRSYCDSLALSGFAALAVDMFKGDATADPTQATRYLELAQPDYSLDAARQAFIALQADSAIQKDRIAVWGIGYGAGFALNLAAENPKLKACVVWQSVTLPQAEILKRTAAPVLGIFADFDVKHPRAEIIAFDYALAEAGVQVETVVLPGGRDFSDPSYGESYSLSAIRDGWQRSVLFLDKQLRL